MGGDQLAMSSDIRDYDIGQFIGKGGFGSVYRGKVIGSGLDVAIKMIDKNIVKTKGTEERVGQEIAIHSQLKHPSILELYHYFENANYVYLILELCPMGEMQKHMKINRMVFNENEARLAMVQIIDGLLYLHKNNIMHRDLSLANILLTENMDVKIADFGLATQLREADEQHMTMCGTPNFISPEVIMRASHGLESDVWSLGCMFYTMLVGTPPFNTKGTKNTLDRIVTAIFTIPSTLSVEATDLIKRLLCKNPPDRIKLTDIMKHKFFTKSGSRMVVTNDNILGLSGTMDSGMGTMSTNSSRNSRPILSRLPVVVESEKSYEHQRSNSSVRSKNSVQRSVQRMELLKPKVDLNKLHQKQISRSIKQDRSEQCSPSDNDENTCSCSKSQCEHVHSNLTKPRCFPQELGRRAWCENSNSNYKSPCCSHLSPCYDANKCSHFDECGCRKRGKHDVEISSKSEKTNKDRSRLDTKRLRPTKKKVENWCMSILESREVCVEYVKKINGVEFVTNGCKISPDGQKMIVYSDYDNRKKTKEFDFDEIPTAHWKKYLYASRFVDVVKGTTAKITLFTNESKNCLMENSPHANFETTFYAGGKVSKTSRGTVIVEKDSSTYTVQSVGGFQYLSPAAGKLLEHFNKCLEICLLHEKALTDLGPGMDNYSFPCTFGRRPALISSPQQVQSPEAINLGKSAFDFVSPPTRQPTPAFSKEVKSKKETTQVEMPNIGVAYKSGDEVLIKYNDGSQLYAHNSTLIVVYTDKYGNERNLAPNGHFDKEMKKKLYPAMNVIREFFSKK